MHIYPRLKVFLNFLLFSRCADMTSSSASKGRSSSAWSISISCPTPALKETLCVRTRRPSACRTTTSQPSNCCSVRYSTRRLCFCYLANRNTKHFRATSNVRVFISSWRSARLRMSCAALPTAVRSRSCGRDCRFPWRRETLYLNTWSCRRRPTWTL